MVEGVLLTNRCWSLSIVTVISSAVRLQLEFEACGRLTGRPRIRVNASDDNIKNTSRKNIVSIIGMISIFVRFPTPVGVSECHSIAAWGSSSRPGKPKLHPLALRTLINRVAACSVCATDCRLRAANRL